MEEKYKLTKEEREKIKEIGLLRIRAKKSVENYRFPATVIAHIQKYKPIKSEKPQTLEEMTKEEKAADAVAEAWGYNPNIHDGCMRKIIEEEIDLCERVLYGNIVSLIAQDQSDKSKYSDLEKKLRPYVEKKLKPDLEKYLALLEKINREERYNEEYLKKFQKWMKTGKPEDFPYIKGRTRSEELKQQDKENLEQMKKYHEAKDKTGLELPVAEGLKESTEEKKTEPEEKLTKKITSMKKNSLYNMFNPFKPTYQKYTESTFLTSLEWGLRSKGILKPKDKGLV